jgi:hypothetical protein
LDTERDPLAEIVEETGGKVWDVGSAKHLEDAFSRVLHEAKGRYLLSYEPAGPARPGWHKVEVRLRRHKGDVRTRRGYFAGGS